MKDDQNHITESAFVMIDNAINGIGELGDIDAVLDQIGDAVNRIEPELLVAAARLTTQEIGDTLAEFCARSARTTNEQPGNSPEQSFLAMVVLAEIKRRAGQDGLGVLEWCHRERIKGFLDD